MGTNPLKKEDDKFFTTPWGTIVPLSRAPIKATEFTPPIKAEEWGIINLEPEVKEEIKPKEATFENAVVDWDEVENDTPSTDTDEGIFTWLDLDAIRNEITRNTTLWKKLASEIKNKQDFESIWGVDPLLKKLWLSTIKSDDTATTLVSSEKALDIADKILAWDKELEKLWLQKWASDERIREFFKSQWESESFITAIIEARDSRLQEKRVQDDALTLLEKKERELNERVEIEQAEIQKNAEKSMNILQRQRALRGVGLSTATEEDIAELKGKWDRLASLARQKANNELALFKGQVEEAEEETLNALRDNFQRSTQALNKAILDQAALTSQLVADWKMDEQLAWDSLMETLNAAWVAKEWADKFTSEASWILSDKFGNPILVNWEVVNLWWTTKAQSSAVNGYVNLLKAEWVGKISSVPANLKDKVIALYDAYAVTQDVTNDQEGLALWLIENLWIKSTEQNIQRFATLIRDKWIDWAREFVEKAWLAKDFEWPIWDAFENISWWLTTSWAKAAQSIINDRLSKWDTNGAIDKLISSVDDGLGTDRKKSVEAEKWLLRDVSRFAVRYFAWADEHPEKAKAWTKVWQTWEDIMQAFNDTNNPELAWMMSWIAKSIQTYRKNLSWAAFSESESKEYASIFPWPFKSLSLNEAKIWELLSSSSNAIDDFYSDKMKGPYDELFPEWIHKRFDPFSQIQFEEEDTGWPGFSTEWLSEDEAAEMSKVFWWWSTGTQFEWNTATHSSWKTFNLLTE